ncbi:glycosyltransferase [Hoylesella oralis]|uniref:glycosyltransferase n=1 Tax=Hoylesella oralis TaxID=28134 RepID=UPI0028E4BB0F|nr:glycosyltransferase [Hoylesella oralis]
METLLTILITTYNRSVALDHILQRFFNYQQKGLVFNVIVSDDQSTDDTAMVVSSWRNKITGFTFVQAGKKEGMDNNFATAYDACTSEYCWLLGDSRYIEFSELKEIIVLLTQKRYDALILRCRKDIEINQKEYSDINNLMIEQGWHITNNASFIIPSSFAKRSRYNRYMGTTFLHYGIAVEGLCLMKRFKVLYCSDIFVKDISLPNFTKKGWQAHAFYNFGKWWYTFVMSLPNQIDIDVKFQVLQDHNLHTGIFSINSVLRAKAMYGKEYIESYFRCRKYIPFVSKIPLWVYDFCMCIPDVLLVVIRTIYRKIYK